SVRTCARAPKEQRCMFMVCSIDSPVPAAGQAGRIRRINPASAAWGSRRLSPRRPRPRARHPRLCAERLDGRGQARPSRAPGLACSLGVFSPMCSLAQSASRSDTQEHPMAPPGKRVGLFVTCLVDLIRPSVGFAAVKLLQDAGCRVDVPVQSCCGQPAWNSGDRATTRAIAEQVIEAFAPYDYVVAPSGSCAGMLKAHYPEIFRGE